jgi:hypothetical protein
VLTAASHCVAPTYDDPYMPTLPLDPGRAAAHSTESYPSAWSWVNSLNVPPEAP